MSCANCDCGKNKIESVTKPLLLLDEKKIVSIVYKSLDDIEKLVRLNPTRYDKRCTTTAVSVTQREIVHYYLDKETNQKIIYQKSTHNDVEEKDNNNDGIMKWYVYSKMFDYDHGSGTISNHCKQTIKTERIEFPVIVDNNNNNNGNKNEPCFRGSECCKSK